MHAQTAFEQTRNIKNKSKIFYLENKKKLTNMKPNEATSIVCWISMCTPQAQDNYTQIRPFCRRLTQI